MYTRPTSYAAFWNMYGEEMIKSATKCLLPIKGFGIQCICKIPFFLPPLEANRYVQITAAKKSSQKELN